MPANPEVGPTAAMIGAARGDRKEEWESDSGASFHISHTRAGMTAYKKTPAGTTVEVVDGTTLPADGFGAVEMDLDQPDATTMPVKMVSVAFMLRLSRNLLSTRKAVEQLDKPLVYYKTKAVLWFLGKESLVSNFWPREGLFSATGVRRTPSQGAALELAVKTVEAMRVEATGQWGSYADVRWSPRQGAALAVAAKVHDMVEVHHALTHPSEETMQKTVQTMGIATTRHWGVCEARLQVKAKRQVGQWIDGPEKTGSNGVGDKDLAVRPGEDDSIEKIGALQLDVQEKELEKSQNPDKASQEASPGPEGVTPEAPSNPEEGTQEVLPDPEKETRKAPSDLEEKTQEAPSDPEEETQEAPLVPEETREVPSDPEGETQKAPRDPKGETQEAPSDPEDETKDLEGLATRSTNLEGSIVPARQKLIISGNLSPNNVITHVESTGERRRGRSSAARFSPDDRRNRRGKRRGE